VRQISDPARQLPPNQYPKEYVKNTKEFKTPKLTEILMIDQFLSFEDY
jgi:hypothetical protein